MHTLDGLGSFSSVLNININGQLPCESTTICKVNIKFLDSQNVNVYQQLKITFPFSWELKKKNPVIKGQGGLV